MSPIEKQPIKIRSYQAEDARALADIYYHTIHTINARNYSQEQLNAWAPKESLELTRWHEKWAKIPPFVATLGEIIVGFAEFEDNGHIDCFYCHHDFTNQGVGSALMSAIEAKALKLGLKRLFTEASITARLFFEAKGFYITEEQTVERKGIQLTNFVMEKTLSI